MKIGVYTFSNAVDNYGQVLQYLATYEYLKERKHDVFLLRLKSPVIKPVIIKFYGFFRGLLKQNEESVFWKKQLSISYNNEKQHPRYFEKFRKTNFAFFYGKPSSIYKAGFDVLVAGSDQIWSGLSTNSFLSYPNYKGKKISLASSTGSVNFNEAQINTLSRYLKSFSFVTTREESGVEMCKKAGYTNATCVLDPSFLITKSVYESYSSEFKNKGRNYILLYMLGSEVEVSTADIFEFAKKNNLDVKYVASQGRIDNFEKIYPTIPEWLALIRDASYVITNSFHGVAFSIIYERPFLSLPLIGLLPRLNERLFSLLYKFGLEDRIYSDTLDLLFYPIDFCKAQSVIKKNIDTVNELMKKNNI